MTSTVLPGRRTSKAAIDKAEQWAAGWTLLAAFLRDHEYVAERIGHVHGEYVLASVSQHPDPVAFIGKVAADAVAYGVRVVRYDSPPHGGIEVRFGPALLRVFAQVDKAYTTANGQLTPLFSIPSQDGEEK